jgi:hypothetical protein
MTSPFDATSGQRTEAVRYWLLDKNNTRIGELMVDRDHVGTIANDTQRSVRRTLGGIVVPPRPTYDVDTTHFYSEDVNTLYTRVAPEWLLGTGETYPLGIFVWGDDSRVLWSWGEPLFGELTDLTTDLDQPLDESLGFDAKQNITAALIEIAESEGIGDDERLVDSTTTATGAPIGWAAGRDTKLKAMESLCAIAGFLPPYYNNAGLLVCRAAPDLTIAQPDFKYGANTVVTLGSPVISNDLLTAPNRYVVVGSGVDDEVVGTFDIPDAAPNSFKNIGRIRRRTVDMQGIESNSAADYAAAAAYASDSSTYNWLAFETPPDPRHDTWDILSFDGANFRQLAWTLELRAGGRMTHDCRGVYT